jgi:hypothetical protein
MAEDCLLQAVRGLRLAHPELGPKPLLAKLVTCSHGVYNTYLLPEASEPLLDGVNCPHVRMRLRVVGVV